MGRTILIVEDFEDTRSFMKLLLEGYGYQVIEASNGAEAVESIKAKSPDLVLMDIAMPIMDGITATEIIRKFETGGDMPIIAVTAHGIHARKRALEAGCDDLISKPINFDEFEAVVNQYMRG